MSRANSKLEHGTNNANPADQLGWAPRVDLKRESDGPRIRIKTRRLIPLSLAEKLWPDGIRCPVVMSFDLDAELLWKVWLTHEPTAIDESLGVYGPKAALPRILSMLRRHGITATFFVPGWIAEKYQEEVKEVAKAGHEIAHHGYLHEDFSRLSVAEQRRALKLGSEAIREVTGKVPKGFRAIPNKNTFKILADEGFLYDSDLMDSDVPYRLAINGKNSDLIELPTSFGFNDTSYFAFTFGMTKPLLSARDVETIYLDEFDALYQEGAYCMFMLHPQIIGRPGRAAMLERTIEHMKRKPGVWFATAEQVATHCRKRLPR